MVEAEAPQRATGSEAAGGQGTQITEEIACSAWISAYCERYQECMPAVITVSFGDLATCRKEGLKNCSKVFDSRAARVTPEGLFNCSKLYRARTCEAFFGRDEVPAECHLGGTLAGGEPCTTGFDCADGCCSVRSDAPCPVCVASLPAGQPCETHQGCDPGLLCSDAGRCAEQAGEGEACDEERPCNRTLYCNKKKICARLGLQGDPCDKNDGSGCDPFHGYFCNPYTGVCTSLAFARAGEPCGYLQGLDGPYTYCILGPVCEFDPSTPQAIQGTCGEALPVGAPCVLGELPECASPAHCLAGVCTVPGENCEVP
jgi:hypothetical protein